MVCGLGLAIFTMFLFCSTPIVWDMHLSLYYIMHLYKIVD